MSDREHAYRPDATVGMQFDHDARVWVLSCSVCLWQRRVRDDEQARTLVEAHGQGHGFRIGARP